MRIIHLSSALPTVLLTLGLIGSTVIVVRSSLVTQLPNSYRRKTQERCYFPYPPQLRRSCLMQQPYYRIQVSGVWITLLYRMRLSK